MIILICELVFVRGGRVAMNSSLMIYVMLPSSILCLVLLMRLYEVLMNRLWYKKTVERSVKCLCREFLADGDISRAVSHNMRLRISVVALIHTGICVLIMLLFYLDSNSIDEMAKAWVEGLMLGNVLSCILNLRTESRNNLAICKINGETYKGQKVIASVAGEERKLAVSDRFLSQIGDDSIIVVFETPAGKRIVKIVLTH